MTVTASPKFGFGTGGRTEEANFKANKFVPGPGTYMSKTFVGREGSRISMGAVLVVDSAEKEKKLKPGPGAYDPNWSSTKNKPSLTKFGSEVRKDLAFEKQRAFQQAPGNYNPVSTAVKEKAAEWKFGSENRPGLVVKG